MAKTTITYWNPLSVENKRKWTPIKGMEDLAEELTLSIDQTTGEYTRLTRFHPGADTKASGGKVTSILKRSLSFPADCMMRHSINGSTPGITQVVPQAKYMGRLEPTSVVRFLRSLFEIGFRVEEKNNRGQNTKKP